MSFYDNNVFLRGNAARTIYGEIKDLPVIDYHCHLDPAAILPPVERAIFNLRGRSSSGERGHKDHKEG